MLTDGQLTALILPMPTVDLGDEELQLLFSMLTVESHESKFPLSERAQRVRKLRDKFSAAVSSSDEPPPPPTTTSGRRRR